MLILFGTLAVKAPLTSLIEELKKLRASLVGMVILTPFILKRSPFISWSPSKAEKASFALTGPTGIVVKPEIGISNAPAVDLTALKPSNKVIFFAVAYGSEYTIYKVHPAEVFEPEPAIRSATV